MKKTNLLALSILAVMFILMIGSVWNDSAITDELAHIPAGYGYVTQLDYRLNPEHPPLVKAIAALSSWLVVRPRFPIDTKAWQSDINGQWDQGRAFLYESGNNADRILFWSRFPLMLMAIGLGRLLFAWTRKRFNTTTALLVLIFYAFSPTVLAHSRYVTTDIGATLGFFIGIASFIAFLESPTRSRLMRAGLCLGIALLLKFSTVLLAPIYAIMLVAWVCSQPYFFTKQRIKQFFRLLGKTVLIGAIGLGVVWAVYALFTLNYPPERQLSDATFLLGSYGFRTAANLDLALIRNPILRPVGQYALGVLMVQQRAGGGNTAYFLGEVTNVGSRSYFPLLYLLKEPLALHVFSLIVLWYAVKKTLRASVGKKRKELITLTRRWIHEHLVEVASMACIGVYLGFSLRSPLNIGIRHLLPMFPFIYILVARTISDWLHSRRIIDPQTAREWLTGIWQIFITSIPKYALVSVLLLWLVAATLGAAPYFLSYYNELVGMRYGYRIAVDSNYDWGQDLIRLKQYVERHDIKKIAVDYFGGGNLDYYLGNRAEPWWSSKGPAHGWFAISINTLQGAYGTPTRGWIRRPEDSYNWLKPYRPVGRVGQSIFIYTLP
ncbi:MAG: phospholipid carrier-dependent glycosyltransferase [Candidatus Sungbacteria bacterium]|nr:phospholipid carrier-dependent glycosyltransferase [Candidatus Sungbacteria bacterium]